MGMILGIFPRMPKGGVVGKKLSFFLGTRKLLDKLIYYENFVNITKGAIIFVTNFGIQQQYF